MLLDTSGLLAYLFDNEPYHRATVALLEDTRPKFTHNYVLSELVALAQARKYPRRTVLEFLTDLATHPKIEIIWIDKELHDGAMSLLAMRPDKAYSLCDAVSFVIMKEKGALEALTTDHHFEQEGFARLLSVLS
jgi:predicted nucleic acid-binding protein